jgi:hypothetical protein
MTITFDKENDIIVYSLEKIISYAKQTQEIVVPQCLWWRASIIGLERGLIRYIDIVRNREYAVRQEESQLLDDSTKELDSEYMSFRVHPSWVDQISSAQKVSSVPRDLAEQQRADNILDCAEKFLAESWRARNQWQLNRVNSLPQTKA